jgi:hypothetical protein
MREVMLAVWIAMYPRRTLRAWVFLPLFIVALTGCAAVPPRASQPCGVIADSLNGVAATDRAGQMRLDIHHARGRAAGCW